jgi:hypothetical protein
VRKVAKSPNAQVAGYLQRASRSTARAAYAAGGLRCDTRRDPGRSATRDVRLLPDGCEKSLGGI